MNRTAPVVFTALLSVVLASSCSKPGEAGGSSPGAPEVAASPTAGQPAVGSERKVKSYRSTMMPGEISQTPRKDSMGMEMAPVYEDQTSSAASPTASQPGAGSVRKVKYYKSTMTLGEISQTPRKDSMGMDMVPVYEDESSNSAQISIDPVTTQNMGVRTAEVTEGPLRRTVRTLGILEPNETTLSDVTTKFKGWIEKLYVDATGKEVKKGEPLFEIYSPDLYTAQSEFVLALSGAANMREAALTRLTYFDVSPDQIARLQQSRTPTKTLTVQAPTDGVVLEKMAVQGQMVEAGMKLYRLADLSVVWLQTQVYEQDLPFVKLGQEAVATISYLSGRRFHGRVTYVYPTVDEKTRTARVRMEFHNPGLFLKPGMFATVELEAELESSALLVPDSAVLRSGERNTVFVALDGGKFEPRDVALGPRGEGNVYQVLSGLQVDERVVTSGQFLLDSESQLREAIQKMLEPAAAATHQQASDRVPAPGPEQGVSGPVASAATMPAASPERRATYACPMPEHASIEYDHSGKCPLCGMTLIPVAAGSVAAKSASAGAAPLPQAPAAIPGPSLPAHPHH